MAHGRGIYMAENPVICSKYGDKLILCRVLLGKQDGTHSGVLEAKPYNSNCYVVKNENQIVPYCVINLSKPMCLSGLTISRLSKLWAMLKDHTVDPQVQIHPKNFGPIQNIMQKTAQNTNSHPGGPSSNTTQRLTPQNRPGSSQVQFQQAQNKPGRQQVQNHQAQKRPGRQQGHIQQAQNIPGPTQAQRQQVQNRPGLTQAQNLQTQNIRGPPPVQAQNIPVPPPAQVQNIPVPPQAQAHIKSGPPQAKNLQAQNTPRPQHAQMPVFWYRRPNHVRQSIQQVQNQLIIPGRPSATPSQNNLQTHPNQNKALAKSEHFISILIKQLLNKLRRHPVLIKYYLKFFWNPKFTVPWLSKFNIPLQQQKDIVRRLLATFIKENPAHRQLFMKSTSGASQLRP